MSYRSILVEIARSIGRRACCSVQYANWRQIATGRSNRATGRTEACIVKWCVHYRTVRVFYLTYFGQANNRMRAIGDEAINLAPTHAWFKGKGTKSVRHTLSGNIEKNQPLFFLLVIFTVQATRICK